MGVSGRGTLVAGVLAAGGVAVGVAAARRMSRRGSLPQRQDHGYVTTRSVSVDRPVQQVREVFQDPERLSAALDRAVALEQTAEGMWTCRVDDVPGGDPAAEAIVRESGNQLSWRLDGIRTPHEGRLLLTPAPGGRGTEIRVELRYPGSRIGRLAAGLRGHDPDQILRTTLRRLKSVLECGQVVSTVDDPSGRGPVAERITRTLREKQATGGRP